MFDPVGIRRIKLHVTCVYVSEPERTQVELTLVVFRRINRKNCTGDERSVLLVELSAGGSNLERAVLDAPEINGQSVVRVKIGGKIKILKVFQYVGSQRVKCADRLVEAALLRKLGINIIIAVLLHKRLFIGEKIYTKPKPVALNINSHCRQRRRKHVKCAVFARSEEHTSELQSPDHLVCRLLLEKK